MLSFEEIIYEIYNYMHQYNRFSYITLVLILLVSMFVSGCTAVANSGGVIPTPTPSPNPLTILTSTLSNGQTGTSYAATLTAQGGQAPYTWSLTTGTLPAGLSLNSSSGAISGTPTIAVTSTPLTFTVTDSGSPASTKTVGLTLTISRPSLAITTTSLPNGHVNTTYSATLSATGATTPYAWFLTSGTLPAGLTLNAATGAITGTPTVAVTSTPLTFKVTDSSTPAASQSANLTLTISSAALVITASSLPNGHVGSPYSTTLAAIGGRTPYIWSITSGTLPVGLSLNASTGALSGTSTATVTSTPLTFKVTDSSIPALSQTANLTLTIAPATLVINTNSLPNGQVGSTYSTTLVAGGGTSPYTWAVTSGTLPAGLALNASSGTITGTPASTVNGTPLTFKVTDSSNPTMSQSVSLTLTITPATLTITTTSLPNGQVNTAYSTTLAATGGTTPYTWSLTSGTVPAGLTLNAATGAITGTPTAPVTSTPLTFKVTDSSNPALTRSVNLTLTFSPAALVITTSSLPNGQVGVSYSSTLKAASGITPYTWSLTTGTLPSGLTLNATSGAITGTPTIAASSTPLTFKVTDSSNPRLTQSVNLTLTVTSVPLSITTRSLPNGLINVVYGTTLAATGGTTPYTWSLASGTLPSGLTLNATSGAITGTSTVAASSTPLTFKVTDSSSPATTQSANFTLTIASSSNISVSLSPKRAGLTLNQTLSVTATTNDSAGVNWTATAGGFSSATSLSGVAVTYTAPGSAGSYTITATSVTDNTKSASVTVGVTDLAGVTTYHNNLSRNGTNTHEYALTTNNVTSSTFGKLFSCPIDSPAYAQPLWVANLNIAGGKHNVVFVASSRDTVYAFDADKSPCVTYWTASLLGSGETYVNTGDVSTGDIQPDIGIVGTPVIDPSTNTLYVVSKSKNIGTSCTPSSSCHQRLHALNLAAHTEKFGAPYDLTPSITVPGTGDGSSNGVVPFDPLRQNQRPGLALVNGVVYIAWASHGDNGPYHGWVIGFAANNIGAGPSAVWNSTPNFVSGSNSDGGIWMSGGAPASDSSNNLYFLTGNGSFDANTGGSNYGDSTIKLSTSGSLHVLDYFTPDNQASINGGDQDHGAGGAAILVDQPSGPVQHLLIGGGKPGTLYLVNRDNMGHFNIGSNNVIQSINLGNSIFATGAFWNNFLYIASSNGHLDQYTFNAGTSQFSLPATHSSPGRYGFPGSTPSVSSLGPSTNGIVWALDNNQYCSGCGPAVLHAYDATNVSSELWNSAQGTGNGAGTAVKFTVPTVANGKVYVPTRSELSVYGLLPN
jgi:hypothetical protein